MPRTLEACRRRGRRRPIGATGPMETRETRVGLATTRPPGTRGRASTGGGRVARDRGSGAPSSFCPTAGLRAPGPDVRGAVGGRARSPGAARPQLVPCRCASSPRVRLGIQVSESRNESSADASGGATSTSPDQRESLAARGRNDWCWSTLRRYAKAVDRTDTCWVALIALRRLCHESAVRAPEAPPEAIHRLAVYLKVVTGVLRHSIHTVVAKLDILRRR